MKWVNLGGYLKDLEAWRYAASYLHDTSTNTFLIDTK